MSQQIITMLTNFKEHVTGAFKQIDTDHALIHEGQVYSAFYKATITTGATLSFSFKTPADKYVHYRQAFIVPSGDAVTTEIYEGATINVAGTALGAQNRNRTSTSIATAELKHGTTFTANGTLLPGFSGWLPGTTGTGQTRSGTPFTGVDEIVLKRDTVYRFVCTNGSSASNVIGFGFRWYEETEG
jgi:hypothetical protein